MPPTNAFIWRMKLDSTNLYLVSRNNEPDYLPSVLGRRVLFSRWEYTDKPLWRCVSLWTMSPDGTQTPVLWGQSDRLARPAQRRGQIPAARGLCSPAART